MTIESTVKLTADQTKAMALIREGKRHTSLFGGSRSGKTALLVLCIVTRALMFPGSRHLIYRLRLKDAIQSIWLETLPKVISWFPGLAVLVKMNETRHVMEFPNGSEIWVAGVDDTRSEDSVLGKEYATIYANEASQIPYLTVWKVRTRLAQKVAGCTAREFVDLNPTTRAHWTYKEFIDKIDPVHSKPGDRLPVADPDSFVSMQLNPTGNMANIDADYLRTLATAPESMRKRFYEGEYATDNTLVVFPIPDTGYYAGKDFDNWVKEVGAGNVRLAAGLDIGFEDADGFVIVAYCPKWESGVPMARDELEAAQRGRTIDKPQPVATRKAWLIYEYKARRTGLADLARAVKSGLEWARKRADDLDLSNANPIIYSDTGGGGAKMVYDLRVEHGLPVVPAYKRDKLSAIERLQDDVKAGMFMVPADGAFAQEAQAIVWTKDVETGEVIRVIDDSQFHPDIMDAILYSMRAVWVQSAGNKR